MICNECSGVNKSGARFCEHCGLAILGVAAATVDTPPALRMSSRPILIGAAAVALLGAGYWFWQPQSSQRLVPLEIEWSKTGNEPTQATSNQMRCTLLNIDGSVINIHSNSIVYSALLDPSAIMEYGLTSPQGPLDAVDGKSYRRELPFDSVAEGYGDLIAIQRSSFDGLATIKNDRLVPIGAKGKVAFIDSFGELKIGPIENSERATSFSPSGVAGVLYNDEVTNDKKWGIIDRTGTLLTSARFDNFVMGNSQFAYFQEGVRWGVVDLAKFVTSPASYEFITSYDDIDPFPNGKLFGYKLAGKWGILNQSGMVATEPKYDQVMGGQSSRNYTAMVGTRWGVYDLDGKTIFAANFDRPLLLFSEGSAAFALADMGSQTSWLDRNGKILKSEKLAMRKLYGGSAPLILATEEYGSPKKNEMAGVFGDTRETVRDERYVILDDRGRVNMKIASQKGMKPNQNIKDHCIMRLVKD